MMRTIETNEMYVMLDEDEGIMAAAQRDKDSLGTLWSYWRKEPFKDPEHVHTTDHFDLDRIRKIFVQSQLRCELEPL